MSTSSTSTLIVSNTFNTSLGVGTDISGPYVDTSTNTAIRLWAYSDQNLQVRIVYADSSSGDSSLTEIYPLYANNTSAINSTKKKNYAKTIVTNPLGGTDATRVVVKTRHSVRDPQPVLTYQTDEVTLQGNFDMDTFEVCLTNIALDPSTSATRIYGSTVSADIGDHRVIRTDNSGQIIISDGTNFTTSAGTASVQIYGQDGSGTKVPFLTDASGRVILSEDAINVDISLDDKIVIHGTKFNSDPVSLLATDYGELITIARAEPTIGPTDVYATMTHLDADSSTTMITRNGASRVLNIMGQTMQTCELKVITSNDMVNYYDTIYTFIIRDTNPFTFTIPVTHYYVKLRPDTDISMTLSFSS